ncbi:hypothetical protein GCM10027093_66240 [Paraburkholderia jirisanensis]
MLSASSYSNDPPGGHSGGFLSGLGSSIINADNALNKALNSRALSSVGQTFNKIGFGLPLVHLVADSLGYGAMKCMEGVGRAFGGKGSVDYHFDKEWRGGQSASACKPSGASGACADPRAGGWNHTRSAFDGSASWRELGFAGAGFRDGCHDARFDVGTTAMRCNDGARGGYYGNSTTQTRFGADGSVTRTETTTRIAPGNPAARNGWNSADFCAPALRTGAFGTAHCAATQLARDIAALHAAQAWSRHDLIAPSLAANGGMWHVELRYA